MKKDGKDKKRGKPPRQREEWNAGNKDKSL